MILRLYPIDSPIIILNKKINKQVARFAVINNKSCLEKHAVGKCMIPGMFDPKIPDEIKGDKQNTRVVFRKDT